ncbi:MAG: 3-dehydroquinate synthase II [Candidatus Methanomethylophilus sp.]|nr:3-dehydroquinate synthase II [Methanomethylophilus sp.]
MEGKKIFVRADLPVDREDRKDLVTNGLESGIVSYILRKGDESFEDLGKMEDVIYFENGQPVSDDVMFSSIDTPEAQDKVLSMVGKKKTIIVETGDWTIIPLENMIAKFRSAGTKVMAVASKKEEAELYLTTMEKGVDGVVIQTDDPLQIGKFRNLLITNEPVELSEVEIVSVEPVEMGDRVCVDTCCLMNPGEGMLCGSYSNCLFLVQSESEANGYVATRPFRVNAGAVHMYCMVPGGGTRYLSEIAAGDPVLVCDRNGKTRNASVGRCKVEVRPLLIVTATDGKKSYNVVLQNAETIKVVTPKGAESVTKLKKGDKVLAHLATGGRHFGMKIEETITEK